ncbi:MAG: UDP-N-acetylmuramate--L-alanine ligase [Alphaproteobacteria bacterium]|nr:UDP-N-acetylmuramate--L-alanine ligase [Alphaproteobacteria bacterium]
MSAPVPFPIGPIHFIGIGGIGMSGIAEVMHTLGYTVQGSDLSENANVKRLRELGLKVEVGQKAENLGDAEIVVISSAIREGNEELKAAREARIPVLRRAEMLAELMRFHWCVSVAGTHGKTTTTSLIAAVMDAAGTDPTVINGGIINAYGTNARLGEGDWMVVEADESDGTFIKLPATVAVVTNVDPEHLDFYGGFDQLKDAFQQFIANVPFYGYAILCLDHPEVKALIGRSTGRILTYGFSPQADIRAVDLVYQAGEARFNVVINDRKSGAKRTIGDLSLPMPGHHNVLNSLAAVAMAQALNVPDEAVRKALSGFEGVARRFTRVGEVAGLTIIDDYAHHPVEIEAVLRAARQAFDGSVIAVVQPHRYSRLKALFHEFCSCFDDADTVIVSNVYPAGETPVSGFDRDALVEGIRDHGHQHVIGIAGEDDLAPVLLDNTTEGDVVVCLGAGSVTQWAHNLPQRLTSNEGGA